MTDILRNSLLSLYADSPEICDMIRQVNFETLNSRFYNELYKRIDPMTFQRIDNFMRSEEVRLYTDAITLSTMAVTRQLSELIEFTLEERKGELN